jgi:hypothetical protein
MNFQLPKKCPSCNSELSVARLNCTNCQTKIEGNYKLPLLARLNDEEQQFVADFVKASGSLKVIAKSLQLSYPSIRNKLDDLITKISELEKDSNDEE